MLQSIQDFPVFYIVAVLLFCLCVFAWAKATKASRRRNAKRDAIIAELQHEKQLRREFKAPTLQQLEETPPERLIEGLCCQVQAKLEKADDMEEAFAALPEPARLVYALGYVITESRNTLSEFFRNFKQPLSGTAWQAVQTCMPKDYAEIFGEQYAAFDEENEATSFNESAILALDERFRALYNEQGEALFEQAKAYVLSHFSVFTAKV